MKKKILVFHTWYDTLIDQAETKKVETLIEESNSLWRFLIQKSSLLRSLFLLYKGFQYDLLVIVSSGLSISHLILLYLFRQKKIVLLEFLALFENEVKTKYKYRIYKILFPHVVKVIQCMSLNDLDKYKQLFGTSIELKYTPWARTFIPQDTENKIRERNQNFTNEILKNPNVFISGRNSIDWETVFKAFDKENWNLTIVCDKGDFETVMSISKKYKVNHTIFCDLPFEKHQELLDKSDIFLLICYERNSSVGHIRIMHATSLGIPIIATYVKGLSEYLVDNENALLIKAEDDAALREKISLLANTPSLRLQLINKAYELGKDYSFYDYKLKLKELIEENL